MTTATSNIDGLVAKLKAAQAALGDGRDCRSENERAAHWATARTVADLISALANLPADLGAVQTRLDDVEAQRREVVAKLAELETEIVNFRDWRTFPDARERDAEWERQHQTRRALERLREGTLWKAPGVVFEPIDYLDRRLKELTERLDRAQAALDAHVEQAKKLLAAQPVATS